MAKFEKGHKKVGGRSKGTSNQVTQTAREWLEGVLSSNREQFAAKLRELPPRDFVAIYCNLLGYVVPKQAAVSVSAQVDAEVKALEALLLQAPEDAVERIALRMVELQRMSAGTMTTATKTH